MTNTDHHTPGLRRIIIFLAATVLFVAVLLFLPEEIGWPERATISIMLYGLILWAFAPVPIGLTSIIVLVLLMLLRPVGIETVLSGFSSPAVFLIIGGMMMAIGVNETPLIRRMTFSLLATMGSTSKGIYIGVGLLNQIQAFFIPATAVRASLMMPVLDGIIREADIKRDSNFNKLLYISTAFGISISGVAVLTAAIGNILTVELLRLYVGVSISYLEWFIYTAPIWILLTIIIMFILWKMYPPRERSFDTLQQEMKKKNEEIGKLTTGEMKCILILIATILIWLTESWHGYHPTFGALFAVMMMALPVVGFVEWQKLLKINFGIVLLIGATLSLGYSLIESGAVDLLEVLVSPQIIIDVLQSVASDTDHGPRFTYISSRCDECFNGSHHIITGADQPFGPIGARSCGDFGPLCCNPAPRLHPGRGNHAQCRRAQHGKAGAAGFPAAGHSFHWGQHHHNNRGGVPLLAVDRILAVKIYRR